MKPSSTRPITPITNNGRSMPILHQRGPEVQRFGERFHVPIGLSDDVCATSITVLNQVLADTMTLRDMYKKHHWQVSGATFYQLHLLFDKHFTEQVELMDLAAERIQALGGISVAMPHDVAEMTSLERPPRGREEVPVQISRLLEAHETMLKHIRKGAKQAAEQGDDGTNDLLVSSFIRKHEEQVWFLSEHLVNLPLLKADQKQELNH